MRTSTAALALVIATTSSVACTVLNDMSSYSVGGVEDTGTPVVVDSGARDSFVPPVDTGARVDAPVDSAANETSTDSMVATAMDSASDSVVETSVDARPDAPVGCHVVVNELQTAGEASGTAGDEFVELFNPCDVAIDLSGYKVVYRSGTGTSDVTVAAIGSKAIAAKGFFVVGNGTFAATADAPFSGIASLSADKGAVGVRDAANTLLDSVAYGSVAVGHAFLEGMPAPQPAAGASISRAPNGADTGNNAADFKNTSSTPKS